MWPTARTYSHRRRSTARAVMDALTEAVSGRKLRRVREHLPDELETLFGPAGGRRLAADAPSPTADVGGMFMSHRNDLNELTEHAAERDTWQHAAADLHEAFQIVGIVLDDLEQRLTAIEAAQRLEPRS